MVSVIEFPVCLLVLVKVSNNLFFLQYKVAEVRVVVLLGMVVRRKSRVFFVGGPIYSVLN